MSANVPRDVRLGLRLAGVGQHWLESGAGDGNRTYRSEAADLFKSGCYEIAGALRALLV
jgi:hypothetical protein